LSLGEECQLIGSPQPRRSRKRKVNPVGKAVPGREKNQEKDIEEKSVEKASYRKGKFRVGDLKEPDSRKTFRIAEWRRIRGRKGNLE